MFCCTCKNAEERAKAAEDAKADPEGAKAAAVVEAKEKKNDEISLTEIKVEKDEEKEKKVETAIN